MLESLLILMVFQIPIKNIKGNKSFRIISFNSFSFACSASALIVLLGFTNSVLCNKHPMDSAPLGFEISGSGYESDRNVDSNHKANNLVSENGIFEFGFFEKDGGEFVVGIRYNLGPKSLNLPVWSVGGGVRVSINSTLKFSMDGRLILFENPSNSIVWSSNTSNSGVETVTLLNNGNLVLVDSQNIVIWESFHRPTNTLLPGQFLRYPQNLRAPSTKSITSYYTFVIRPEGLALMWESNITYWKTQLSASSATIKEVRFNSDGVLGLYDDSNKVIWSISSIDSGDTSVSLRHLRIDQDGNLRIYSWNNALRSWKVGWQAVEDQCNVFGSCGLYSVCGYNSTGPICGCLYSDPLDRGNGIPSSDSNSGCKKMGDLGNCKAHTSMLVMKQTVLYGLYPPHDIDMMLSEESCKEYCANDTTCLALTSKNDGSGLCTVKRTAFISGSTSPSIPSTSFLKVCLVPQAVAAKGANPNSTPKPKSISFPFQGDFRKLISAVLFVILVTVLVILGLQMFTLVFVYHKRRKNSDKKTIGAKANVKDSVLIRLSFKEVEELTSGFSTPLGGSMFKGFLPEKMAVVVKVVDGTVISENEFVKVAAVLGGTHHRNLVSLKGFCSESKHRVLIYEYISNGSADKWIFEEEKEKNWQKRVDIAVGVTRALAYLHTECHLCIPHGNLKLENVLLDEKMVAKLTDFGVKSFLCSSSSSNESQPEKDIYMLGKLLIEIVLCSRDTVEDLYSLDFVMEKVIKEQKYLDGEDLSGVERMVRIALWCMQKQPFLRPSVGEVMKVLEGTLSVDRPPSSFAYRNGDDVTEEIESGS